VTGLVPVWSRMSVYYAAYRDAVRFASSVCASFSLIAIALGGCEEQRRALGEECIRNEDCLTGICGSRICISERPKVDIRPAQASDDAGTPADPEPSDANAGDSRADARGS
jgi:hypothetical protein